MHVSAGSKSIIGSPRWVGVIRKRSTDPSKPAERCWGAIEDLMHAVCHLVILRYTSEDLGRCAMLLDPRHYAIVRYLIFVGVEIGIIEIHRESDLVIVLKKHVYFSLRTRIIEK